MKNFIYILENNLVAIVIAICCIILRFYPHNINDIYGVRQNSTMCELIAPFPDQCKSVTTCSRILCDTAQKFDMIAFQYGNHPTNCNQLHITSVVTYLIGISISTMSIIIYACCHNTGVINNTLPASSLYLIGSGFVLITIICDIIQGYLDIVVSSLGVALVFQMLINICYIIKRE